MQVTQSKAPGLAARELSNHYTQSKHPNTSIAAPPTMRAPTELQTLITTYQRVLALPQGLGLKPSQQSQQQQRHIVLLNTINLLAILPVKLVLASVYALESHWPETLLIGSTFALMVAIIAMHGRGKLSFSTYCQYTLISSFSCPFILTFLLGGYHNSSLVMVWSFLTPILAILLGRPQTARRWLGLFVVFNLLVIGIDGSHSSSELAGRYHQGLLAFNGIGIGILIFSCLYYLHRQNQQTIQQLDQFASLVAHELRSPLTSIRLGLGHGLRQSERLSASQIQALLSASQEVQRSQRILDDLLQISRATSSCSALYQQRLDPYPILLRMAEQAQQQRGVEIQLHCQLSPPERLLRAAPNPLSQIMANLIENSANYADPGQPLELAIRADPGSEQLQIQLADRGQPFSKQQCQAIFAPFGRLANASGQPGSGLGLTLVRRLAEAMGGSVSATARPGGGLIVTMSLPRAAPAQDQPKPLASPWSWAVAGGGGDSRPIALIGNHPQERVLYPSKG